MDAILTDKAFWKGYWDQRDVRVSIGNKYLFHKLFREFCQGGKIESSIEVGGFPGYFSVFLAKHLDVKPTLLDFYIDSEKVQQLCEFNGLSSDRIELIEHDFLSYESDRQYDLVFSCGLIEHFENIEELIDRHIDLLAPGGRLFVEIPNLLGLNGWVQNRWDPENLAIHNLASMDLERLRASAERHKLSEIQASYFGRFGTWLERFDSQSWKVRTAYRTVHKVGRQVAKLVPGETRFFSPYIILTATKGDAANSASSRHAA